MGTGKDLDQSIKKSTAGLKNEDNKVFDEIADHYYTQLLKAANSILHSQVDAEETVQDALLRAYRALPYFRQEASIFTWLYRIVINQAKSRKRKRSGQIPVMGLNKILNPNLTKASPGNVCSPIYLPFYNLCRREINNLLLKEIDSLPEFMQQTVYLRYIKNMSCLQIADTLHCSQGTVKSRLARARSILKKRLQPYRYDLFVK